jgi:thioredoxin 1
MAEDEELEKIKKKKLNELMNRKSDPSPAVIDVPVEVTDQNFAEVTEGHPLVVIDCWALGCAPCRMLAPIIEGLAKDYAGKIVFGKLDVAENQQIQMKYQIMGVPTLLVFKNGQLVDQIVGAMPRKMLEPRITQHL